MFYPNEPVIDDNNFEEHTSGVIDGHMFSRGLVERDWSKHPVGSMPGVSAFDTNIELIPRNEWSSRIKDMEQSGSRLSDIRMVANNGSPIPSLDQNGWNYCWAHSPVSACLMLRAVANQPYVRLSACSVACKIKNYRNDGGWNAQALEFISNNGVASVEDWPENSGSRSNDNQKTWENAARYKVTEGWMDIHPAVYDRNLTFDQVMTCLIMRLPVPVDLYWWLHSVCAVDPVEVDSSLQLNDINRWGIRIWNSWKDSYGSMGMAVLRGKKAVPDGATAPRVAVAS